MSNFPTPDVTKKKRNFSLIWFVPIVAVLLSAWLVYQNWVSKGPLVTIAFQNASGLEAGVTKIKYRDVSIGLVETVEIGADFENVFVTARVNKEVAPYLNESTAFWVERPRIGSGGISGLGTLFSGAHIGFEASKGEKSLRMFTGLEEPPILDGDSQGVRIRLNAEKVGFLNAGDPVYYKNFKVGTVTSVQLDESFKNVTADVFVTSPYDKLVHSDSRFWNVSGVSAEINSEGITVNFQSVESLLIGGIEFDSPSLSGEYTIATNDSSFQLYNSFQDTGTESFGNKLYFILNFDQSIRGLNVDALVEYRGLKIGKVINIGSRYDQKNGVILLPVLVEIEPERLGVTIADTSPTEQAYREISNLGLHAKLETANLITGQLYVSLDFYKDKEAPVLDEFDGFRQLPTISTDLTRIAANVGEALEKINGLEIEKLLESLNTTVLTMNDTIKTADRFMMNTDKSVDKTVTSINATLARTNALLDTGKILIERGQTVMQGLDEGSATRYQLDQTLVELQAAARSLKRLTETIEKNPNSIIFGKQKSKTQ